MVGRCLRYRQGVAVDLRSLASSSPPSVSVIHSVLSELFVPPPSSSFDRQQRCRMLELLTAIPLADPSPGSEPVALRACMSAYGTLALSSRVAARLPYGCALLGRGLDDHRFPAPQPWHHFIPPLPMDRCIAVVRVTSCRARAAVSSQPWHRERDGDHRHRQSIVCAVRPGCLGDGGSPHGR